MSTFKRLNDVSLFVNLKKDTDELIYKTETVSRTKENNPMVTDGYGEGG